MNITIGIVEQSYNTLLIKKLESGSEYLGIIVIPNYPKRESPKPIRVPRKHWLVRVTIVAGVCQSEQVGLLLAPKPEMV